MIDYLISMSKDKDYIQLSAPDGVYLTIYEHSTEQDIWKAAKFICEYMITKTSSVTIEQIDKEADEFARIMTSD